mgnify:CR=1 FL=1
MKKVYDISVFVSDETGTSQWVVALTDPGEEPYWLNTFDSKNLAIDYAVFVSEAVSLKVEVAHESHSD